MSPLRNWEYRPGIHMVTGEKILQPSRLWRLKRWLDEDIYLSWWKLALGMAVLFVVALGATLMVLSR